MVMVGKKANVYFQRREFPIKEVRNCEERSDELGMRKYRSLSTYPTSFSLDIDTIITAT